MCEFREQFLPIMCNSGKSLFQFSSDSGPKPFNSIPIPSCDFSLQLNSDSNSTGPQNPWNSYSNSGIGITSRWFLQCFLSGHPWSSPHSISEKPGKPGIPVWKTRETRKTRQPGKLGIPGRKTRDTGIPVIIIGFFGLLGFLGFLGLLGFFGFLGFFRFLGFLGFRRGWWP